MQSPPRRSNLRHSPTPPTRLALRLRAKARRRRARTATKVTGSGLDKIRPAAFRATSRESARALLGELVVSRSGRRVVNLEKAGMQREERASGEKGLVGLYLLKTYSLTQCVSCSVFSSFCGLYRSLRGKHVLQEQPDLFQIKWKFKEQGIQSSSDTY